MQLLNSANSPRPGCEIRHSLWNGGCWQVLIGFRPYPIEWWIAFVRRESIPLNVFYFPIGWTRGRFIRLPDQVLCERNLASQNPLSSRSIREALAKNKD